LAINGEAYPEAWACIGGSAFPDKLSTQWEEWFNNPKLKFDYVEKYEKLLYKMVPKVADQAESKSKALTKDNWLFEEHCTSDYLAAKKVLKAMVKYNSLDHSVPRYDIKQSR